MFTGLILSLSYQALCDERADDLIILVIETDLAELKIRCERGADVRNVYLHRGVLNNREQVT